MSAPLPYYAALGLALWLKDAEGKIYNVMLSVSKLPADGDLSGMIEEILADLAPQGVQPASWEELGAFAHEKLLEHQAHMLGKMMYERSLEPEELRKFLQDAIPEGEA